MIAKLFTYEQPLLMENFTHTTRIGAISFENGIYKEIKCEHA
jgi:hypothetical protein